MDWLFKKRIVENNLQLITTLKFCLKDETTTEQKMGAGSLMHEFIACQSITFFCQRFFPHLCSTEPAEVWYGCSKHEIFLLMLEDWQWVMELKLFNAAILDIITSKCNTSWGRIPLSGCIFERKIGYLRCLKTDHFVCGRWHFVTDKNTMQNDNALTRPYIGGRLVKPKYPSVTRDT